MTVPASAAAPLLDLVASHVDWAEAHRQPHPDVMAGFAQAGLLRVLAPAVCGGGECSLLEFLELVETIAYVDGSAAWTVMTANEEMEITAAHVPTAALTRLLTGHPAAIVAGSGIPAGKARRAPSDDGWVVQGRWRFVTGSPTAEHLVLASLVDGPGRPRPFCHVLVPAADARIVDTWHTTGLRGTGSNDVVLEDCFVPDERAGVGNGLTALVDSPFFRLASGLRFPFPKVAVAAGIARRAIEAFVTLAQEKHPVRSSSLLRDRPAAAVAVAEAEALRDAGWALVVQRAAEVWALAESGTPVPPELHARARLACSHAVRSCVRAVETVCSAAGTSANEAGSVLDRCFRDVHAVPQHFMVAPHQIDTAGRVLLGLDPGDPVF